MNQDFTFSIGWSGIFNRQTRISPACACFKGGGGNYQPLPPPAPPSPISAAQAVETNRQLVAARRSQGFDSTILTSAMGVKNLVSLTPKTLLGQ